MNPRKFFAKTSSAGPLFQTTRDNPGRLRRLTRHGAVFALVALLTAAFFYSGSRASSPGGSKNSAPPLAGGNLLKAGLDFSFIPPPANPLAVFFQPPSVGTINTFAADCATAKTSFVLGETVCVQVSGVPTNSGYFINWLNSNTQIVSGGSGVTDITSDPQTFTYTLTASDAVGAWKATIANSGDSSINPAVFTVSAPAPALATYAFDISTSACTNTAKTTFSYGETVCAKVTGVNTSFGRRVAWLDPSGFIRQNGGNLYTALTTDPQTFTFTLPTADTTVVEQFINDNRGTWKVNVVTNRGSLHLSAPFVVQGPTPTADLAVAEGLTQGAVGAGQPITYIISVTNRGPYDAANVELISSAPVNATFDSVVQTAGPTFTCTGSEPLVCTAASLPNGASALFEVTYITGAAGATLANTASVTSTTPDPNNQDNSTAAPQVRVSGTASGDTCTLTCPDSMVVYANTTQDNVRGAVVEFGVENSGSCGTVTSTPASNTFFPVGATTVTTSSSTGGGACSFTVTVIEADPPTIECRPDLSVFAATGETEVEVSVSVPLVTGNNVSRTGVRSDNRPLTDPYPIGETTITWTATDAENRSASCVQKVTVSPAPGDEPPTISCPADVTATAAEGACQVTVSLGTPTTTGNGVTTSAERSDGLGLSAAYPAGTTIITWTATDSFGRTASCLQTVTVSATDTTAPTVTAPANRTFFTPAGACSIILDDEIGFPNASDNCSGVTITTTGIPAGNAYPTGVTTLTYTATDAAGNVSATKTQTITVKENPAVLPSITAPPDVTFNTGAGAASCGVTISDADLGTPTAADNCSLVSVTRSPAGNVFPVGETNVVWTATDASGNKKTAIQKVTVKDNTPPSIAAPGPVTVNADVGPSCAATGVSLGSPVTGDNCAVQSVTNNAPASFPLGDTVVTWTVTDIHGNTASASQTVTVLNPKPVVTITGPASGTIAAVNTPVTFNATYTDVGGGTHTATWSFDAITAAGTVTEPSGSTPGTVTATQSFSTPGVYFVTLTVNDSCGETGSTNQVGGLDAMVVIYDPNGGFATGGGWINSPAGAYAANPSLTGKANFGFVSKYHNGATVPVGQTEFQFKAGSLNFSSSSYEWLVIAGSRAKYKGSGTINGGGNYGFLLTAIDGQASGGGGTDKFRVKIWDKNNGDAVVYDNQMGAGIDDDPTTALGGGNIVVHKPN